MDYEKVKEITAKDLFENKFKHALQAWCNHYKIIGTPSESPRYSQIMDDFDNDWALRSTITSVKYHVPLTEEEKEFLRIESAYNDLWSQWKAYRTEYLKANEPTIDWK